MVLLEQVNSSVFSALVASQSSLGFVSRVVFSFTSLCLMVISDLKKEMKFLEVIFTTSVHWNSAEVFTNMTLKKEFKRRLLMDRALAIS